MAEVRGEGWMREAADVEFVQQLTSQGEPAQGELKLARGEFAQGELARGELARGEPARGEPARGELARGELAQGEPAQRELAQVVSIALLQEEVGAFFAAALASPFVFADTPTSLWAGSSVSSWCCDPCNKTGLFLGQVFSPTQRASPD